MLSTNFTKGWYVLYTRPRQEKKTHDLLSKNFETYLPMKRELRQWSDRKKWVDSPLFTSYLFIHLKDIQEYRYSVSLEGVCKYVNFNGRLAKVTDPEIKTIKLLMDNFENIEFAPIHIRVGERRTISQGSLIGYDCEVIRFEGKDRVLVKIDSLKQSLMAVLNTSDLKKTA